MSDIGDINSPVNVGCRSTKVDPKLFGKPSDFSETVGNGGTSSGYFVTGLVSSTQLRNGWITQQVHLESLWKRPLDVVKTVTHKRGFEIWRKLCKEYGSTTGTSLHEYTNLLEYDFGTTDGFKNKLLKWENQIVDFEKATGEVFSDRLKCAIVSRSSAPIRTYLRRIEEITELFEWHW